MEARSQQPEVSIPAKEKMAQLLLPSNQLVSNFDFILQLEAWHSQ
jgi:hypothetical protein